MANLEMAKSVRLTNSHSITKCINEFQLKRGEKGHVKKHVNVSVCGFRLTDTVHLSSQRHFADKTAKSSKQQFLLNYGSSQMVPPLWKQTVLPFVALFSG